MDKGIRLIGEDAWFGGKNKIGPSAEIEERGDERHRNHLEINPLDSENPCKKDLRRRVENCNRGYYRSIRV